MARSLSFDETESLDEVLMRYHRLGSKVGLGNAELLAGESSVRTIHNALCESISLGNQAHFEKRIGQGRASLKIIALPRCQRSVMKRLLDRFFGA